jgi:hypothetical protein
MPVSIMMYLEDFLSHAIQLVILLLPMQMIYTNMLIAEQAAQTINTSV